MIPALHLLTTFALLQGASDWRVQDKEDIKQTLHFAGTAPTHKLIVDNINGSITVTGYSGAEVQLAARKTLRARSEEKLAEAREKIKLEISERGDEIELYVDGPFRQCERDRHNRGSREEGYEAEFDFTLQVPFQTDLCLKTVNDGDLEVADVAGQFELDNINGAISMREVAGGGHVYALNGEVAVRFKKNPEFDSYFGSLNGDVRVEFLQNLAAEVRLKTFNGEVYTDFPVSALPVRPATAEKQGKRFIYHSDGAYGVRIGSGGGTKLEFDTFNGDIHILQRRN